MKFTIFSTLFIVVTFSKCIYNITGECSNKIYKQINDKQGKYRVVKFERGCGATTGNNIQLSLIKYTDSLPNESGNIYISNSKVGGYIERDTSIDVTWLDEKLILIRHDSDLRIFKSDTSVDGVKITYQLK